MSAMEENNYSCMTVELQYINDSSITNIDFKKHPSKPKAYIMDRYEALEDQIENMHAAVKAPFDHKIATLQVDNNQVYLSLADSLSDHDAYKDVVAKRETVRLILRTSITYRCENFINALNDPQIADKSSILKSISNSVYRDEELGYHFLKRDGLKILIKSLSASPANIIELVNCISYFLLFGGSIGILSNDKMFIRWLYGILRCREPKIAVKVVKIYEIMIKLKGGKSDFIVENILEFEKQAEFKFGHFMELLKLKNMEPNIKDLLSFLILCVRSCSQIKVCSEILASLEKQGLSTLTARFAKSNNTPLINLCSSYKKLKSDRLKVAKPVEERKSIKAKSPPEIGRIKHISSKTMKVNRSEKKPIKIKKEIKSQTKVKKIKKSDTSSKEIYSGKSKHRKRIGDLFDAMDNHYLGDFDFSDLTNSDDTAKLSNEKETPYSTDQNKGAGAPPPPPPPSTGAAPPPPGAPPAAPPGAPVAPPPGPMGKAAANDDNSVKCVQLFWGSLDRTKLSKNINLTIWGKLPKNIRIDDQEIIALFKLKDTKVLTAGAATVAKAAKALDSQRYQMVSIILHKLPTVEEIEKTVTDMAYEEFSATVFKNIKQILPTEEEISMIEDFMSRDEGIPKESPEIFMHSLSKIPYIRISVEEMLFFVDFESFEQDNGKLLYEFKEAVKEVMNSDLLAQVLAVLMLVGNVVNRKKIKYGFHINYLSKLSLVSDTATKKPILHHVCRILDENNYEIDDPKSKFPYLPQAMRIDLLMIKQEYEKIHKTYEALKHEEEAIKDDTPGRTRAKKIIEKISIKLKLFQIVYQRILNRFKKLALYLGCSEDELSSINIKEFLTMINSFLVDFDAQIKKYRAFKEAEKIQELRKKKTIEKITDVNALPNNEDVDSETSEGDIKDLFSAVSLSNKDVDEKSDEENDDT